MVKYNTCILDFSNEPSGIVCDSVIEKMKDSLNEIKSKFKDKSYERIISSLEECFYKSKQKMSASYLNELFNWSINCDDSDFKAICKKHFKSITEFAESKEVFQEAVDYLKSKIVKNGFKDLHRTGYERFSVFEYNGTLVGFPLLYRKDVCWIIRGAGGHKTECAVFPDEHCDSYYNVNKSGNIDNLCSAVKNEVENLKKSHFIAKCKCASDELVKIAREVAKSGFIKEYADNYKNVNAFISFKCEKEEANSSEARYAIREMKREMENDMAVLESKFRGKDYFVDIKNPIFTSCFTKSNDCRIVMKANIVVFKDANHIDDTRLTGIQLEKLGYREL